MSKKKAQWDERPVKDGIGDVWLSSWRDFTDYVNERLLKYRGYIYRGQASHKWPLQPSLDRLIEASGQSDTPDLRKLHLNRFIHASRGRRGPNPRVIYNENEWWALGQHHGLATPLLDWTESPFVALYFAFEPEATANEEHRVVYGVYEAHLIRESKRTAEAVEQLSSEERPPIVEVIRPVTDENSRLVSQQGLFTRTPDGVPLEDWIREHNQKKDNWRLVRIFIPNQERSHCLRLLNRMNINHLSLFPDLHGASQYCNADLKLRSQTTEPVLDQGMF